MGPGRASLSFSKKTNLGQNSVVNFSYGSCEKKEKQKIEISRD
jgi:hypothetical protein